MSLSTRTMHPRACRGSGNALGNVRGVTRGAWTVATVPRRRRCDSARPRSSTTTSPLCPVSRRELIRATVPTKKRLSELVKYVVSTPFTAALPSDPQSGAGPTRAAVASARHQDGLAFAYDATPTSSFRMLGKTSWLPGRRASSAEYSRKRCPAATPCTGWTSGAEKASIGSVT
jgi:hypothetical protein